MIIYDSYLGDDKTSWWILRVVFYQLPSAGFSINAMSATPTPWGWKLRDPWSTGQAAGRWWMGPRSCGAESRCTEWWDVQLLKGFLFCELVHFLDMFLVGCCCCCCCVMTQWFMTAMVNGWRCSDVLRMWQRSNVNRRIFFGINTKQVFQGLLGVWLYNPSWRLRTRLTLVAHEQLSAIVSHTSDHQPHKHRQGNPQESQHFLRQGRLGSSISFFLLKSSADKHIAPRLCESDTLGANMAKRRCKCYGAVSISGSERYR